MDRELLPTKVAQTLRSEITRGRLGPEIPGYRELERLLGVSRTSITPAIHMLVEEGVLQSRGPRRRLRVAERFQPEASSRGGKLLLLEPNLIGAPSLQALEFVKNLHELADPDGWQIEHLAPKLDQSRSARRRWQSMVHPSNATRLLLFAPHRALCEWAVESGLAVLSVGGDTGALPLARIGFSSVAMVRESVGRLIASGHRDICVPVGVRTPGFVAGIEKAVAEAYRSGGLSYHSRLHVPRWESNHPDAWAEGLEWRFRLSLPDALVLVGSGPYQVTQGVLMSFGLKVPDDVSLIGAFDPGELPWMRPRPCGFQFRIKRLANLAYRWLRRPSSVLGHHDLKTPWLEGDSFAAHRNPAD